MDFVDRKRWDEIGTLFVQAIERTAAERAAFIDTACSGDPDLRREVERLLEAHDSAGGFLDSLDSTRAAALIHATTGDDDGPDVIGAYRVIRRLGGGGMGVVYLAHDPRLDRPVALKVLRARFGADERSRQRVIAEARAASALDHPHIVPLYEIGEAADGRLFIAMAYRGGESLAERLRRGPLAPREAAELARRIADALAAAHRQGIVHRDVKPANVIIADGQARLVDFGIALVAGRGAASMSGAAGTLAYMSPEQARGGDVDHKSDVWSLGVVLYEMLTGQRPFRSAPPTRFAPAVPSPAPSPPPPPDLSASVPHRAAAPDDVVHYSRAEPIRLLRPEVPEQLARIAESCLAMDPVRRPPGAAAIVSELDAFLRTDAAPGAPPRRRWGTLPRVAAAIVLAAAAAFLLVVNRGGAPSAVTGPTLAVLPFAPVTADAELERIGRELAITLSTNLDGAAGIRVVEPIAVLLVRLLALPLRAQLPRRDGRQRDRRHGDRAPYRVPGARSPAGRRAAGRRPARTPRNATRDHRTFPDLLARVVRAGRPAHASRRLPRPDVRRSTLRAGANGRAQSAFRPRVGAPVLGRRSRARHREQRPLPRSPRRAAARQPPSRRVGPRNA